MSAVLFGMLSGAARSPQGARPAAAGAAAAGAAARGAAARGAAARAVDRGAAAAEADPDPFDPKVLPALLQHFSISDPISVSEELQGTFAIVTEAVKQARAQLMVPIPVSEAEFVLRMKFACMRRVRDEMSLYRMIQPVVSRQKLHEFCIEFTTQTLQKAPPPLEEGEILNAQQPQWLPSETTLPPISKRIAPCESAPAPIVSCGEFHKLWTIPCAAEAPKPAPTISDFSFGSSDMLVRLDDDAIVPYVQKIMFDTFTALNARYLSTRRAPSGLQPVAQVKPQPLPPIVQPGQATVHQHWLFDYRLGFTPASVEAPDIDEAARIRAYDDEQRAQRGMPAVRTRDEELRIIRKAGERVREHKISMAAHRWLQREHFVLAHAIFIINRLRDELNGPLFASCPPHAPERALRSVITDYATTVFAASENRIAVMPPRTDPFVRLVSMTPRVPSPDAGPPMQPSLIYGNMLSYRIERQRPPMPPIAARAFPTASFDSALHASGIPNAPDGDVTSALRAREDKELVGAFVEAYAQTDAPTHAEAETSALVNAFASPKPRKVTRQRSREVPPLRDEDSIAKTRPRRTVARPSYNDD